MNEVKVLALRGHFTNNLFPRRHTSGKCLCLRSAEPLMKSITINQRRAMSAKRHAFRDSGLSHPAHSAQQWKICVVSLAEAEPCSPPYPRERLSSLRSPYEKQRTHTGSLGTAELRRVLYLACGRGSAVSKCIASSSLW
jgi:hypothetical protein